MEVVIDGVLYLPAKQVLANRDSIIRGLMSEFWGEIDKDYDEAKICNGVFVYVDDNGQGIPLLRMVDIITKYSQRAPEEIKQ